MLSVKSTGWALVAMGCDEMAVTCVQWRRAAPCRLAPHTYSGGAKRLSLHGGTNRIFETAVVFTRFLSAVLGRVGWLVLVVGDAAQLSDIAP